MQYGRIGCWRDYMQYGAVLLHDNRALLSCRAATTYTNGELTTL